MRRARQPETIAARMAADVPERFTRLRMALLSQPAPRSADVLLARLVRYRVGARARHWAACVWRREPATPPWAW